MTPSEQNTEVRGDGAESGRPADRRAAAGWRPDRGVNRVAITSRSVGRLLRSRDNELGPAAIRPPCGCPAQVRGPGAEVCTAKSGVGLSAGVARGLSFSKLSSFTQMKQPRISSEH